MIATCVICGAEFVAKRSTAKYCSCRCKHIAHRGTGSASTAPPIVRAAMTDGEVWEIVCRAHELAADLSRASMRLITSQNVTAPKLGAALAQGHLV